MNGTILGFIAVVIKKTVLPSLLEPFASLASDSECQTWLPGLDSIRRTSPRKKDP